jgi:YidC/Oxa1 family membrane protein insertase
MNNQMSTAAGPMKYMSYAMPVVFMFVLNSFPAGLSFYYLVSNIVSIVQQAIIKRFVDEDALRAQLVANKNKSVSTPDGAPKKNRFMARMEEAMKQRENQQQFNKKNKK